MSFPSDSPFYSDDQRARESREADRFSVRKVGQPNIVEIPVSVLEDWIAEIDGAVSGGFTDPDPDFEGLLDQMRSYFKG